MTADNYVVTSSDLKPCGAAQIYYLILCLLKRLVESFGSLSVALKQYWKLKTLNLTMKDFIVSVWYLEHEASGNEERSHFMSVEVEADHSTVTENYYSGQIREK